ncbi:VpaChn25_0724 family phage protein [Megalodesulfovibrio paquesii]
MSQVSFAETLTKDRRLVILRFLSEAPACRLNTAVLRTSLDAFGHSVSRDQVETDAAWLNEQGLVTVEEVGPVRVATLTTRGLDVAEGRAVVPGVKRPGPRAGL